MAEKGRDVSDLAHQLSRRRAILAANLCRIGTRDNENPSCPPSSKPSKYVSMNVAAYNSQVELSADFYS